MIGGEETELLFRCVRLSLGKGEDWDFLSGRTRECIFARMIVFHALKDEKYQDIGKVLRLDRSTIYHYAEIYEDIKTSYLYKKERNIIRKFNKIYEFYRKEFMEQNKGKRELSENDFWNCVNGYFAGTCRCRAMKGDTECILVKGSEHCSNFNEGEDKI